MGPITLKAPLCSQKTELETEKKEGKKGRKKEESFKKVVGLIRNKRKVR